jgi:hypothetical protein
LLSYPGGPGYPKDGMGSPVLGLRISGVKCGLTWKSSTPPGAYRLPVGANPPSNQP